MVNDRGGYNLIAPEVELAERLLLKLVISESVPALGIIEAMPR